MSIDDFQEIYHQYNEQATQEHRLRMEEHRASVVTLVNLLPHYKETLKAQEVWPFPWDEKKQKKKNRPQSSKERMLMLAEKWRKK